MASAYEKIQKAKIEYETAKKKGDKKGMAAAHLKADQARNYNTVTKVDEKGRLYQAPSLESGTLKPIKPVVKPTPQIPLATKVRTGVKKNVPETTMTNFTLPMGKTIQVPTIVPKKNVLEEAFDPTENYIEKAKKGNLSGATANFVGTGISAGGTFARNALNNFQSLAQGKGVQKFKPQLSFRDLEEEVYKRSGDKPISQMLTDKNPLLGSAYGLAGEILTDPLELTPIGFANDIKMARGFKPNSQAYQMALQSGKLNPAGLTATLPSQNTPAPRVVPPVVAKNAPVQQTINTPIQPRARMQSEIPPQPPVAPVRPRNPNLGVEIPKEQPFAKNDNLRMAENVVPEKDDVLTQNIKPSPKPIIQKVDSGNINTAREKMNFSKEKKSLGNLWEKFRTQFTDDLAPLENVEKQIRGKIPSAEKSLYKQARLFRGLPEKANLVIENELKPIIKSIEKTGRDYKDLGLYSEMVHARDVNKAGINSGFTNAEIDDVIRNLGSPEMEAARKELVAYSNRRLDTLVNSGVTAKGQVDAMRNKWPNYMPLNRVFDDDKVEFSSGLGKSFVNVGDPIQKLKGSNRKVIDPIESMIKNTYKTEMAAGRNNVGRQLASLATDDVQSNLVRKLADKEEVGRKNVVNIMENGEKINYEVTPEVYRALKDMGKESSNLLIKAFQAPASVLRAGATLTPEFAIRNPMRDVMQAFINSESGFNPITDFAVGLASYIKKGDLYKSFLENNGGYGNIISMDRNSHREIINKMLKEKPSTKFVNIINPAAWLRVMRTVSDATESATKVGEFRAALRKGATPQEAAYRARDLMDFAKAGSSIRQVNKVVAFLNANIQGKSKLVRSIQRDPLGVGTRMVATMAVPSIGAYAANNALANDTQKAQIKDAPNWLKDTFWLIAIPGTDIVARLPKPFEGAAVSNVIERFMDYMLENDKNAFDDFIQSTASQQSIPTMLTGLTPIIEGMTNYSFFRQSPIIPMREQYLQRKDQQDIYTSEVGKAIAGGIGKVFGEETNFSSPRIVDNTIKGVTAGLGGYALDFVDIVAGVNRPAKTTTQLPLVKAFTVNENSSGKSMELVYDEADKLTKLKNSSEKALPALESYQLELLAGAKEQMSNLSKEIRSIQSDPLMAPVAKRDKLSPLLKERNEIARTAAAKYSELKEKGSTPEFAQYEKSYVPELVGMSDRRKEVYVSAKEVGITPEQYVEIIDLAKAANEDGKGSAKKREAISVLREYKINGKPLSTRQYGIMLNAINSNYGINTIK